MQLTPEQIQGVLELEPRAQVDRLRGDRPYIRVGYWGKIRDLDRLQAGLAKLGLQAVEVDDYDEDTGWNYWYQLEPIQEAVNELDTKRWAKLAGINESYKIGDKIELNPKYFGSYEFPEGYIGVVKNVDKADYMDDTPVYTVQIKNIDPTGDEYDQIDVEDKQVY